MVHQCVQRKGVHKYNDVRAKESCLQERVLGNNTVRAEQEGVHVDRSGMLDGNEVCTEEVFARARGQ